MQPQQRPQAAPQAPIPQIEAKITGDFQQITFDHTAVNQLIGPLLERNETNRRRVGLKPGPAKGIETLRIFLRNGLVEFFEGELSDPNDQRLLITRDTANAAWYALLKQLAPQSEPEETTEAPDTPETKTLEGVTISPLAGNYVQVRFNKAAVEARGIAHADRITSFSIFINTKTGRVEHFTGESTEGDTMPTHINRDSALNLYSTIKDHVLATTSSCKTAA